MTLTVDAFIAKWTASGGSERASEIVAHHRAVADPREDLPFPLPSCPRTPR